MLVRSDIITRDDIGVAVREAGVHFLDTESREGWYVPVREFKPRGYRNGFEFFLSGSSPYAVNRPIYRYDGSKPKAATWDEWGIVIDALYSLDPDARIGHYTDRSDFIEQTSAERERIAQWQDPASYQARTHKAPWLD